MVLTSDVGTIMPDFGPDELIQEMIEIKSQVYAHVLLLSNPYQCFVFDHTFTKAGRPLEVSDIKKIRMTEVIHDVFRGSEEFMNPNKYRCCFELLGCELSETTDGRLLLTDIIANPSTPQGLRDDLEATSYYNALGLAWMNRLGEDPKKISALFEFSFAGLL